MGKQRVYGDAVLSANGVTQAVRALPKIELHRHLEGAVRLETLIDIAIEYGIEMPEYNVEQLRPFVQMMPGQTRSAQMFLAKFQTLRQFFRSPDVIRRVTREVVEDAAADNVRYMELRFTPQALANILNCEYEEVLSWVCEEARSVGIQRDIDVRLIVSMNRHEGLDIGARVLDAALDFRASGVVGLDLAGQEANFSAEPFAPLFHRAKEEGLGVTVHAGEWAGAASVRVALHTLRADRIGHGVRALEDSSILQYIIKHNVPLEVCPTSNYHSGVVNLIEEHPLRELYSMSVRTTINTDDPLLSNITLSDELLAAVQLMGMSLGEVKDMMLNAARCAFLPPSERDSLVARFAAWYSV